MRKVKKKTVTIPSLAKRLVSFLRLMVLVIISFSLVLIVWVPLGFWTKHIAYRIIPVYDNVGIFFWNYSQLYWTTIL